jgi:hypothetical protein
MKQELEALILQEEMEKNLIEEKINNFQDEEIKIVRRIKTSTNDLGDYQVSTPNKKTSSKSNNNSSYKKK